MTILIEAWMAHEGYAEDCWRLEGWLQSGKINKMTEAPLRGYMCPAEINISLKLLLRANQKTIEGSKLHIYEKPSSCRYTRLTMPKKTCTDVINTLHVCPNWCLSVFENLSTVHRKVCGDGVFTICLARQRKRAMTQYPCPLVPIGNQGLSSRQLITRGGRGTYGAMMMS